MEERQIEIIKMNKVNKVTENTIIDHKAHSNFNVGLIIFQKHDTFNQLHSTIIARVLPKKMLFIKSLKNNEKFSKKITIIFKLYFFSYLN